MNARNAIAASLDPGPLLIARFKDAGSNRSADDAVRLAERFHLGGIIFSNLAGFRSPHEVAGLLARVAEASDSVPFLALDEEGGEAHPLGAFLPGLPSPRAAAQKGLSAVERLGELIGAASKFLGFNTNLAPALDLARSTSETQSFGSEPQQVARSGEAWVRAMTRHGILAGGKHFPGRADAGAAGAVESGGKLPVISRTMAQLWREDLAPYRELISRLPMVKIGVAACKAYDPQILRPATLSAGVIEGLLRSKLQFEGAAVADISETAAAVADTMTLGEVAAQSLAAGCDLLIVEGRDHLIEAATSEIARAIESGALDTERIGQARRRVERLKKGMRRPSGKVSVRDWDRLAREFHALGKECEPATSGAQRIA